MNVGELIEKLKLLDPDAVVTTHGMNGLYNLEEIELATIVCNVHNDLFDGPHEFFAKMLRPMRANEKVIKAICVGADPAISRQRINSRKPVRTKSNELRLLSGPGIDRQWQTQAHL